MLTVLLATRNRAGILQNVLEIFCRLQQPAAGRKLVVVDNGSTDRTGDVLVSFTNRPPLHGAFEPSAGKNLALNRGLALLETFGTRRNRKVRRLTGGTSDARARHCYSFILMSASYQIVNSI
jgi:glycosyltransferase involved in cell wall biosynthesis